MKLINCEGKEVKVGDMVMNDDEVLFVESIVKPHKPSSTGKVCVHDEDKAWSQCYYPSVLGMEWVDREDQR